MRVLITGANGFIGKNLQIFLSQDKNISIDTFTRDNSLQDLEEKLKKADFIIHLAGVNRPQTEAEFYSDNTDLTKHIIDFLNDNHLTSPLIFSSSIQAELDNDYGKSKRLAENYILDNYSPGIVFRLHNVFGKDCRPNYNSVVATFCHNIAHDLPISINNPDKELELIYIDDICKTFIDVVYDKVKTNPKYNYVTPTYRITLEALASTIQDFNSDLSSINVPTTGDEFTKKLFSTFISYLPLERLITNATENADERGIFAELIHTKDSGQVSVSTSKPGITRGNHYHHTKIEKFIVLDGEAIIKIRKIGETKTHEFSISSNKLQIITIPVGYTHNITNVGNKDMILLIWCNEIFNKNNPDTFYEEV